MSSSTRECSLLALASTLASSSFTPWKSACTQQTDTDAEIQMILVSSSDDCCMHEYSLMALVSTLASSSFTPGGKPARRLRDFSLQCVQILFRLWHVCMHCPGFLRIPGTDLSLS